LTKDAYDLACFKVKQAAQLYCKAAILAPLGDFPRTYSIIDLLAELSDIHGSSKDIKLFIEFNRETLKFLETVYITSRYFAITFRKGGCQKATRDC
jgi:HEPN domain-containing protein